MKNTMDKKNKSEEGMDFIDFLVGMFGFYIILVVVNIIPDHYYGFAMILTFLLFFILIKLFSHWLNYRYKGFEK